MTKLSTRPPAAPPKPPWAVALAIAAAATALAIGGMFWARAAFQIRILPERIVEWLLIFVPLDVFETVLATFGANAKVLATYGTVAGLGLVLLLIGTLVLRRRFPTWLLSALGPVLWLFAMGIIMPVTGAGFFATDLFRDVALTNVTYLAIAFGYSGVLLLGQFVATRIPAIQDEVANGSTRRAFLITLGGATGSLAATYWLGRMAGSTSSGLPLARVEPRTSPLAPTGTPAIVAAAPLGGAPAATPAPTETVPVATPTPDIPEPPPARALARDKDGTLTAAGRRPGELPSPITSNEDFYIVSKNAVADPVLAGAGWRLIIDGSVQRPVQIDYSTLRRLPPVSTYKTFECISNFTSECRLAPFGCDLISNAAWTGVRLRDILDLAGGPRPSTQDIAILSADEFSSAIPLDVALDPDTLLVYEMNGEVLPREHGYPARLLIPGRYGMKNPKWVIAIRAVEKHHVGYYEARNWNEQGIVKTMSRIDVPAFGAKLPAGRNRIAGIAYGGKRGVSKVEYSADGQATWQTARFLEPPLGQDTWVRWEGEFDLPAGAGRTLWSRATDGEGNLQSEAFSLPQPDGGSGWNSVEVSAA